MAWMIWGGVALVLGGLIAIVWSGVKVGKLRNAGLSDDELRAKIGVVIPFNIAGLLVCGLGLGMVTVGLILSA